MDMYIEKDLPKSLGVNNPSVCYVCASPDSASHFLRTRPFSSQPYFPFLEHHKQPAGCKLPGTSGLVLVCYICYSFLISQWETHEKNQTPHSSRLYWLKRADQGPYLGTDGHSQDKRNINNTTQLENNKEIRPPPGQIEDCISLLKRPRRLSWENHQGIEKSLSELSKGQKCNAGEKSVMEALDLRSSASVNRERQSDTGLLSCNSVISHSNSSTSNLQSGDGAIEILDLSMPDKNATTEVCYVCGEEFQKGLLSHVFAKSIQHYPFFPSLMLHSRPSRSRPMDSTGRVQACEVCHAYLLQQWQQHQTRSTPHAERNYLLRNRQTTAYDTTTFICYACGLEYPSSSLRLLYCRPNAESEPYFPFLENALAPNGSSPISPQGMVQVCAICYKSIPQRHKVFGTAETVAVVRPRLVSPPVQETEAVASAASSEPLETTQLAAQLYCYVCHKVSETDGMKLLSCYPDSRSPGSHEMHFPFLKTLAPAPGSAYFDSFNRTLVCSDCFAHFNHQWHVFENDGLALELRHYTLPPHSLQSHSITKTNAQGHNKTAAGGSTNAPSHSSSSVTPIPVGTSDRATPSRHSVSRTPPNSGAGSSPSVASDPHKENSAESSIYCYLCGLNSTRAFSHWLPAAPPPQSETTSTTTPYFPYIRRFAASSRAERLREDGAALVCSFCYHMVHSQWKQYEDAPASKSLQPDTRVYNTHDYVCYVCSVATYRRRVRALPVKDFPFLKQHRQPRNSLSIESGKFVVVCLDCFESLRSQSLEYERWGLPVEKRQYNWMAIPPPPEDSNNLSTPLERLIAMEQQKRQKRSRMEAVAAVSAQQQSSTGEEATKRTIVDSTTRCLPTESNRDVVK